MGHNTKTGRTATPWEGTITVQVTGEFVYEIDYLWEARDADHARELVEVELADYLGHAFLYERFQEHWDVKPLPQKETA